MAGIRYYLGYIKRYIDKLQLSILRNVEYSEHQMVILGIVGFIGFPLFYLIWRYVFPQPYENLTLRIIGSVIGFFLMLKDYWPKPLRRYLPLYWYLDALYSLPFFFGFYLLKSDWSVISVMSMLCAVFLLVLLVDWLSLNILFFLGTFLAIVAYLTTTPGAQLPQFYIQYLLVYLFAIVTGSVFNYKTAILRREKLAAMSLMTSSIAHELRTPLLGIKSGSIGMKRYLPILFEAYNMAREQGLPVTQIRAAHYNALVMALERIEAETNNANTIIDMLLMNVGKQVIDSSMFEVCSVVDCVNEALKRYPFMSSHEHQKILWQPSQDASFRGVKLLLVHVLFNLLKNALHYIAKARKGKIHIWMVDEDKYCSLYFKDTGIGIPAETLPRIFERFFSTTLAGSGIGLSFCKIVIESFGGSMTCNSEYGSYTEFRIRLPKLTGPNEPAVLNPGQNPQRS